MAELRISFVVDHVLQKDVSKTDIIDTVSPLAKIVFIHTHADNSLARHTARELNRTDAGRVFDNDGVRARAAFHASNLSQTENPADFEWLVLVVNTDDGYAPELHEIIAFIKAGYDKE